MLPAPTAPFDVPLWVEKAKVHPDHHTQLSPPLVALRSNRYGEKVADAA